MHECLDKDGKVKNDHYNYVMILLRLMTHPVPLQVLIPVFALGRAQELCILLESYWYGLLLCIMICVEY